MRIEEVKSKIKELLDEARKCASLTPDIADSLCEQAMTLVNEYQLVQEEGWVYLTYGLIERTRSNSAAMLAHAFKANAIFLSTQDYEGQVRANNLISIAYFYLSLYESSLSYCLTTLELLKSFSNDFLLCSVLNNFGEIHRETGNSQKALEYYQEALDISEKNRFKGNTAAILSNIGEAYALQHNYEQALHFFHESYDILAQQQDMVNLGDLENRLSKLYVEAGQYELAIDYAKSAYQRLQSVNNQYYLLDVLVNLYELKVKVADPRAIDYLLQASDVAGAISSSKKQCLIYQHLSNHYESLDQYDVSLGYLKKYVLINEELMISAMSTKLEVLSLEMQYIKEMSEFASLRQRLEQEVVLKQAELEKIKIANEVLEKKAYEDELTGILNRRSINGYLNHLFELQTNHSIALFMIDIDFFKRYNDYWGHAKGDECIKAISQAITQVQRARKDVFGRYGGEEFIYVALNIDANQAIELGNTMRRSIEKLGLFYVHKGQKAPVTLSVGCAVGHLMDAKHYANLLEMADEQLYHAKDHGRNQLSHTVFTIE